MTSGCWVIGDPSCTVFTPWGESLNGPADDSQGIAAQLHKVHEQGPCLRCGHYACPCCLDWCDLIECQCFEEYDAACIYGNSERCRAVKESEQPRSAAEWFKKITALKRPERCGAPATVQTVLGPMCELCAARFQERTREGKNLLGVLVQLREESKK